MLSYNFFESSAELDKVVEIINLSFSGEGTDEKVLVQIFKVMWKTNLLISRIS